MSLSTPPPPSLEGDRPSNSTGKNSAGQQDSEIPLGWKPTVAKPLPALRCQHIKRDGERCRKWGVPGTGGWCLKHGAALPAVRKAAESRVAEARVRMMGLAPDMLDILYELTKPGVQDGIRLKAAQDLLDRAGLKAGMDINVTVEHVGSPLEEINKAHGHYGWTCCR